MPYVVPFVWCCHFVCRISEGYAVDCADWTWSPSSWQPWSRACCDYVQPKALPHRRWHWWFRVPHQGTQSFVGISALFEVNHADLLVRFRIRITTSVSRLSRFFFLQLFICIQRDTVCAIFWPISTRNCKRKMLVIYFIAQLWIIVKIFEREVWCLRIFNFL